MLSWFIVAGSSAQAQDLGQAWPLAMSSVSAPELAATVTCSDVDGSIYAASVEYEAFAYAQEPGAWNGWGQVAGSTQAWGLWPQTVQAGVQGCPGDSDHGRAQMAVVPGDQPFIDVGVVSCGEAFAWFGMDITITSGVPWELECVLAVHPGLEVPVVPGVQQVVTAFGDEPPVLVTQSGGDVESDVFLSTTYEGDVLDPSGWTEGVAFFAFSQTGGPGTTTMRIEQASMRWSVGDVDGNGVFGPEDAALAVEGGPAAVDYDGDGAPDADDAAALQTLVDLGVGLEPAACADLDGSGLVGGADIAILLAQWGTSGPECPADLDGDGFVTAADLGVLLAAWGTLCEA